MKSLISRKLILGAIAAFAFTAPMSASATPVSFNVAGTFAVATGSLSDLLGVAFTSGFTYDTDTSQAIPGSLDFANPANGGTGQELRDALGVCHACRRGRGLCQHAAGCRKRE